ncbi:MAG: cysteine peptidase family C39 domain-containing protein, partial [Myxococcota bacterium]
HRAGRTRITKQTATGVRPGAISLLHQGATNACGTTSLSMVMRYWQGSTEANTVAAIDAEIRPSNAPSDPRDLQRYAQAQGLRAGVIRGGTPHQLTSLLDQGTPPIIVIWSGNQLHYVAVTGYQRTVNGDQTNVNFTLADPAAGTRTVSRERLQELWGNHAQNYLITVAPSGSRQIAGLDGRSRAANQLTVYDSDPGIVDGLVSTGVDIVGEIIS